MGQATLAGPLGPCGPVRGPPCRALAGRWLGRGGGVEPPMDVRESFDHRIETRARFLKRFRENGWQRLQGAESPRTWGSMSKVSLPTIGIGRVRLHFASCGRPTPDGLDSPPGASATFDPLAVEDARAGREAPALPVGPTAGDYSRGVEVR